LYRKVVVSLGDGLVDEYFALYEDAEVNVRSDTAADLGVVPASRVDVQPKEMWDLAEWMQDNVRGLQFETAGTLREGRDIWILMKRDHPLTVQGDPQGDTVPYLALQNGYVSGSAFRFEQVYVRIVCANTSAAADMEADSSGHNYSLAHTTNLWERIEEIKEMMLRWDEEADQWVEAKEHMARQKVTIPGVNWFVDEFIPMPDERITSARVKENVELARLELIGELYNARNVGIEGTALGLFEAASSWNEHVRAARTPQSRFQRAVLSRDNVLQAAHSLALKAATI
jgi:phage/plasmid-like protein (TIGR03299 family)